MCVHTVCLSACTPVHVCLAGVMWCLKCVCVSVLVLSFVRESVGTTRVCGSFRSLTWTVSKQLGSLMKYLSLFSLLSADLLWAAVWADSVVNSVAFKWPLWTRPPLMVY